MDIWDIKEYLSGRGYDITVSVVNGGYEVILAEDLYAERFFIPVGVLSIPTLRDIIIVFESRRLGDCSRLGSTVKEF